jgi:hypothetical protein
MRCSVPIQLAIAAWAAVARVGAAADVAPPPTAGASSPLEIRLTGPDRVKLGDLARVMITVVNRGVEPAERVRVAVLTDTELDIVGAEQDYEIHAGALTWTVDTLGADRTAFFRIDCLGAKQSSMACVRASAGAAMHAENHAQVCLQVIPSAGTEPEARADSAKQAPAVPAARPTVGFAAICNCSPPRRWLGARRGRRLCR